MSVNFETNNLIVSYYEPGAGGKFLLNTLGLSKSVVLQSSDLAKQQLIGALSPSDKFDILIDRLSQVETEWNDLNLGCQQLWCNRNDDPNFFNSFEKTFKFHPIIEQLSKSNLMFGLVSHTYPRLLEILQVWPNAKILFLDNTHQFIEKYRSQLNRHNLLKYWSTIRGPDWPKFPPESAQELADIDRRVLDELTTKFDNMIYCFLNKESDQKKIREERQQIKKTLQETNFIFEWNCDWFLNQDCFLNNAKILYDRFRLKDFDEHLISIYYDQWIFCLSKLNTNYLQLNTNYLKS